MGCLNSEGQFEHWFGNIHLSGPCNRSCYFCIGQHMMALDPLNNLDEWPLKNINKFIDRCSDKNINEINITGSNTDPLLYKHLPQLYNYLIDQIPDLKFGLRTNGVADNKIAWTLFDKASISITSLDPNVYKKTMGSGKPPIIRKIIEDNPDLDVKVNIVLCPEIIVGRDIARTLSILDHIGVKRINLREPYGQPHIGDPLKYSSTFEQVGEHHGMPVYKRKNGTTEITYWDVHYVEVESVNLYANGVVSDTYPVSKGHDQETGKVMDQSNFTQGRHVEQWVKLPSRS